MSERYVEIPGARLWSVARGEGPALVMLHGGPGMWDYLGPVAAMLEDTHRVIRYDQRGCGRSTGDGPYDVATAVADMDAVRAAHDVERWAVFGHSWGGSLGLLYALAHPERTSALVYVSGTGVDPAWHEEYRAERLRRIPPERRARWVELRARNELTDAERRELTDMSFAADLADPSRLEDVKAWLYADGFAVNERANRDLGVDAARVLETPEVSDRLRWLKIPTLVMHGQLDPRPPRRAAQIAELIPGAELFLMPNVGHFPRFEAPEPFREAVRRFLIPS